MKWSFHISFISFHILGNNIKEVKMEESLGLGKKKFWPWNRYRDLILVSVADTETKFRSYTNLECFRAESVASVWTLSCIGAVFESGNRGTNLSFTIFLVSIYTILLYFRSTDWVAVEYRHFNIEGEIRNVQYTTLWNFWVVSQSSWSADCFYCANKNLFRESFWNNFEPHC